MSTSYSPKIVTSGLVLFLDAANPRSYGGSGTVWSDLSGNGVVGTLNNGTAYTSSNGGALVLDGVDDNVSLPSSVKTSFAGLQKATLTAWVASGSYFVVGFCPLNNASGHRFCFGWNASYIYWEIENGSTSYPSSSAAVWSTKPANVAMVFDGSQSGLSRITAYVNGVPQTLAAGGNLPPATLDTTPSDFYIWGVSRLFSVSGYNRALSAAEIKQNFNSTKGRYGL